MPKLKNPVRKLKKKNSISSRQGENHSAVTKQDRSKKARKVAPWILTLILILITIVLIEGIWALFISGPYKIHQEHQAQVVQAIKKEVPQIEGLTQTAFEYETWQGFDGETLYWFDGEGKLVTTRALETLDYNKAKAEALEKYEIEAESIQTAYGYTAPVYEIRGSGKLLLLDYDSLKWIYEREDK